MNTFDTIILYLLTALGAFVCICGLLAAILWLCWYIYKNAVGWPIIWKALTELKKLEKENAELREEVVFVFSGDEVPLYTQGYEKGAHELSEPVTAEMCTHLVSYIQKLRKELGKKPGEK